MEYFLEIEVDKQGVTLTVDCDQVWHSRTWQCVILTVDCDMVWYLQ